MFDYQKYLTVRYKYWVEMYINQATPLDRIVAEFCAKEKAKSDLYAYMVELANKWEGDDADTSES